MALPQMTPEQRAAALEKARIVREKRSEAMKKLADGKMKPKAFMENSDPVYAKVKVSAFLKKLPGVGAAKAAKALEICKIPENRRLGGLGANQKAALLQWIDENVK
ncbi:MAG: integration host factor [Eggerthellaceae bacterium]|nr:integration host factor [Eggerthellaceae bacterium]